LPVAMVIRPSPASQDCAPLAAGESVCCFPPQPVTASASTAIAANARFMQSSS